MRQREFDIMKGIGIIAMIIGHIWPSGIIYAFHMPLFFFVSGYFYKPMPNIKCVTSNFRSLIIRYYLAGMITALILFIFDRNFFTIYASNYLFDRYCHGVSSGPIWFLFSLFWCRIVYNILFKYINYRLILFVLFVLTSTQVLVTRDVLDFNILPFSLQTVIPGLLFFSMGFAWRMHKKRFFPSIKHPVILSMLVVSVLTFFQMDYPNLE